MRCLSPVEVNGREFNCGRCINCRINYTSMWSLRLIYELSVSDSASFLTLTYDQEHYPKDGGLDKKELQNFFKRLRINLKREYHEFAPKLKYYACGEYGSKSGRCHYHAIVFNLDNFNDQHREIVRKSWTNCESWLFDKERGRQSGMQEVTPDDISYVTGYVQKKLSGDLAKEKYGERIPPFSLASQGLGLEFALKNKERLVTNGYTYFKGHKVSVPRYFCEKFDVKKSDLISPTPIATKEEFEKNISSMWQMFVEDMKRKGTYYPDNIPMLSRRFEQWYQNRRYEYAERIYEDFRHRQALRGKL